jgi:type 2 lantibiotic biosynthesis protein LanM
MERALAIIARAAPPGERAAGVHFAPADAAPAAVRERARRWIDAAARGDEAAFARVLEARGTSRAAFEAGLRDVRVRDPRQLPAWAGAFLDFLSAQEAADTIAAPRRRAAPPAPASEPGTPLDRAIARVFQACAAAAQLPAPTEGPGPAVSPAAAAQLARQLAARLLRATARALDFELRVARTLGGVTGGEGEEPSFDVTIDGWLNRLETLPALAYVIGVTCSNWRRGTAEMLARLRADWRLLRSALWGGADPASLVGVRCDCGDPHDGGRTVAILEFSGDCRVVYKTKDMRGSAAFMQLVRFLNQGVRLQLPTRAVLPRSGYGWEAFVKHEPCATRADLEAFYERMGMTLRLLELVEARDFWLDNLIACGAFPVFVDLETLLQARKTRVDDAASAEARVWRRIEESVVPTGAVSAPSAAGAGRRAEDFGALAPRRVCRTQLRPALEALQAAASMTPLDDEGYMLWTPPPYAPVLDGEEHTVADHLGSLGAGYRAMDRRLDESRALLAARDGPLHRLKDLPVRFIWRDTWSCYTILDASLGPQALTDGIDREIALARLFRTETAAAEWGATTRKVVASEIDALRDLDIPLFLTIPTQSSVFDSHGQELGRFFAGTAYQRLLGRLEGEGPGVDERLDLVHSALACGAGPVSRPVPGVAPGGGALPGSGGWLAHAVAIGDFILALAERDSAGRAAWPGIVYDPRHDLRRVAPLNADLLTGTCGLAVLFAELFGLTGLSRFESIARGALAGSLEAVAAFTGRLEQGSFTARGARAREHAIGGFVGIGAQLYTLRRCGSVLRDPAVLQAAAACADRLPGATIARDAPLDGVGGLAGLLLALTSRVEGAAAATAPAVGWLAREVESRYGEGRTPPASSCPHDSELLQCLPGAGDAVVLALARAAQRAARGPWPGATTGALRSSRLWGGPSPTAGALLARLAPEVNVPDEEVLADLDRAVRFDPSAAGTLALVDGIELAVAGHARTARPRYLDQAAAMGLVLTARFADTGSWFPDRWCADRHNLSAVNGVAAIALAFLRIGAPGRVRSIRLLQ